MIYRFWQWLFGSPRKPVYFVNSDAVDIEKLQEQLGDSAIVVPVVAEHNVCTYVMAV